MKKPTKSQWAVYSVKHIGENSPSRASGCPARPLKVKKKGIVAGCAVSMRKIKRYKKRG